MAASLSEMILRFTDEHLQKMLEANSSEREKFQRSCADLSLPLIDEATLGEVTSEEHALWNTLTQLKEIYADNAVVLKKLGSLENQLLTAILVDDKTIDEPEDISSDDFSEKSKMPSEYAFSDEDENEDTIDLERTAVFSALTSVAMRQLNQPNFSLDRVLMADPVNIMLPKDRAPTQEERKNASNPTNVMATYRSWISSAMWEQLEFSAAKVSELIKADIDLSNKLTAILSCYLRYQEILPPIAKEFLYPEKGPSIENFPCTVNGEKNTFLHHLNTKLSEQERSLNPKQLREHLLSGYIGMCLQFLASKIEALMSTHNVQSVKQRIEKEFLIICMGFIAKGLREGKNNEQILNDIFSFLKQDLIEKIAAEKSNLKNPLNFKNFIKKEYDSNFNRLPQLINEKYKSHAEELIEQVNAIKAAIWAFHFPAAEKKSEKSSKFSLNFLKSSSSPNAAEKRREQRAEIDKRIAELPQEIQAEIRKIEFDVQPKTEYYAAFQRALGLVPSSSSQAVPGIHSAPASSSSASSMPSSLSPQSVPVSSSSAAMWGSASQSSASARRSAFAQHRTPPSSNPASPGSSNSDEKRKDGPPSPRMGSKE